MAPNEGTMLIVEDDAPVARLLQRQLEEAGYETAVAGLGSVALQLAETTPLTLVILDVQLPDMSGYEVCRQLRRLYHPWALPVLMLTGMTRPVDQLRGFAHGADAYVTKPYTWDALHAMIEQLLGHQAVS